MAESKVPAKFTITWDGGRYFVSIPNYKGGEVVPADLVEPLVEALRCLPVEWLKSGVAADSRSDGLRIEMHIVGTTYKAEITVGDLRSARAALSSWEAGQ